MGMRDRGQVGDTPKKRCVFFKYDNSAVCRHH